jgi:hypothetical protein
MGYVEEGLRTGLLIAWDFVEGKECDSLRDRRETEVNRENLNVWQLVTEHME